MHGCACDNHMHVFTTEPTASYCLLYVEIKHQLVSYSKLQPASQFITTVTLTANYIRLLLV